MNRVEFMAYYEENFSDIGAYHLIDNILQYAEGITDEDAQYRFLCDMLDGTGLSDNEIKQICL